MNFKAAFVFLIGICLLQNIGAQSAPHFGPAFDELQKQRQLYGYPTTQWDSLRCVWFNDCATQQQSISTPRSACSLNKRFFGWHVIGTSSSSYQWASITDLSYFSYDLNPSTGNANNSTQIANWSTDAAIVAAHTNGVNVNLCVTLFNNTNEFSTFFASSSAQSTCITNLVNAVVAANAKGINIDFEGSGLNSTYLTQFTNFISALSSQLHNTVTGSELSIDLAGSYAGSSTLITQLNPYIDLFILMGYDYYWNSQGLPGPVAPLYDFYSSSYGNVSNDMNSMLKVISPGKLLLGMPYYGRRWGVANGCTLPGTGSGSAAISTQTYTQYKQNSNGYYSNPQHDTHTFNAYSCFTDVNSTPNQQFIDDAYSFQKKYSAIKQRGLAGAAVWRLGYDAGYNDLWNLVQSNLSSCAVNNCTDTIYDMGGPFGNYHNNEDYTFTIAPSGAYSVTLSFLSFDVESGYDYLKIYEGFNTSGPLLANLSGNTLPAQITADSGAMTLHFHSDGATVKAGFTAVYTCSTVNPCTDTYEPNNSTANAYNLFATALGSDTQTAVLSSYIFSGTDQDWYKINNVGFNGNLTIGLTGLPANYDMELYDSAGLCSPCYMAGSYNTGTTAESITYNYSTGSGHRPPFYLKVYPNSNTQFSQCSAYTINASWVPAHVCRVPPVPVVISANSNCPGAAAIGNINLAWHKVDSAFYNYQIRKFPFSDTDMVVSQNCVPDTSVIINANQFVDGQIYNWQVSATTDCDTCNSVFSTVSYFYVKPHLLPTGSTQICEGDSAHIYTPWHNAASYQWYRNGASFGPDTNSICATQPGTYYVALSYNGNAACNVPVLSDSITLSVNPLPLVDAGNDTAITIGDTITLNAVVTGAAPFYYHWFPDSTLSNGGVINPQAFPRSTTPYLLLVTDSNSCMKADTIIVQVNPPACSYAVSHTAHHFPFSGGSDTILVSTNVPTCNWQLTNNNNWLHVSVLGIQTGDAAVIISADTCTADSTRTGTFEIAGYTFSVSQACQAAFICSVPVADFIASQTSGNCPLTIYFTNQSTVTGNYTSSWLFYTGLAQPVSSNLQNPTNIIYEAPGSFAVQLTVTDSCGSNTKLIDNYITVNCPTGVNTAQNQLQFSAYPNPANNVLYVDVPAVMPLHIVISNAMGQIVFQQSSVAQHHSIDLSHFSTGTYFLSIVTDNENRFYRLVKQ